MPIKDAILISPRLKPGALRIKFSKGLEKIGLVGADLSLMGMGRDPITSA
jgi:hypothetical protein